MRFHGFSHLSVQRTNLAKKSDLRSKDFIQNTDYYGKLSAMDANAICY